jgi:hypothetical protein
MVYSVWQQAEEFRKENKLLTNQQLHALTKHIYRYSNNCSTNNQSRQDILNCDRWSQECWNMHFSHSYVIILHSLVVSMSE